MSSVALSAIIVVLVLGGVFIGSGLRRMPPHHHLSKDSQESSGSASGSLPPSARWCSVC